MNLNMACVSLTQALTRYVSAQWGPECREQDRNLVEPEMLLPSEEIALNETAGVEFPDGPVGKRGDRKPRILMEHPSRFDLPCFLAVSALCVCAIHYGSHLSVRRLREEEPADVAARQVGMREVAWSSCVTAGAVLALVARGHLYDERTFDFPLLYALEFSTVYTLALPLWERIPFGRQKPFHLKVTRTDRGKGGEEVLEWRFKPSQAVLLALDAALLAAYVRWPHWLMQDALNLGFAAVQVSRWLVRSLKDGLACAYAFLAQDLAWSLVAPRLLGTRAVDDNCRMKGIVGNIVIPHFWAKREVGYHDHTSFGVADIVVPGLFVAFLRRFDQSREGPHLHYYVAVVFYVCGVLVSFLFRDIFGNKHYLLPIIVPLSTLPPLALAALRSELQPLLQYRDSAE